ncbi:MAG: nucleotidyltransferase [Chloroflexota bacterium]|nr:nucleotidyltransferase [Chloroflexota bacterium]
MPTNRENPSTPTIREILAGYRAVNEREREEARERLPRLTVEESVRQYLWMRNLARRVAPDAERFFVEQRKAHYVRLHERLKRAARKMGSGPLIDAIRRLKEFLEAHGIPYMVIGGVANSVWGQPRYTHDVDLKVSLGEQRIAEFAALLSQHFRFRYPDGAAFAQRTYVLMIDVTEQVPADLAVGFLPYEIEAIARAVPTDVGGVVVPICTAEDLVIHKTIAAREKDWMDIEGILTRQRSRLDQFTQALDRPEIVTRYQELRATIEA